MENMVEFSFVKDFPGGPVVKNLPAKTGDRVLSLVWEDPTLCKATQPMHNYWTHMPQLPKRAYSRACAPQQEKPPQWEAHTLQLESCHN